ncbi:MAG: hypothetical protein WA705_24945 [Candidatus Ozemobacteraceae bacterium]
MDMQLVYKQDQAGNLVIMSLFFNSQDNVYALPQDLTVIGNTIGFDMNLSDYSLGSDTNGKRGFVRRFDGTINSSSNLTLNTANFLTKTWGGYPLAGIYCLRHSHGYYNFGL